MSELEKARIRLQQKIATSRLAETLARKERDASLQAEEAKKQGILAEYNSRVNPILQREQNALLKLVTLIEIPELFDELAKEVKKREGIRLLKTTKFNLTFDGNVLPSDPVEQAQFCIELLNKNRISSLLISNLEVQYSYTRADSDSASGYLLEYVVTPDGEICWQVGGSTSGKFNSKSPTAHEDVESLADRFIELLESGNRPYYYYHRNSSSIPDDYGRERGFGPI